VLKTVAKSSKLANVCYDIRGPVLEKARQMEEEGHKIIKLNWRCSGWSRPTRSCRT
jgi:alanine-synthesizing transaminase